jgi:hypothetical protein
MAKKCIVHASSAPQGYPIGLLKCSTKGDLNTCEGLFLFWPVHVKIQTSSPGFHSTARHGIVRSARGWGCWRSQLKNHLFMHSNPYHHQPFHVPKRYLHPVCGRGQVTRSPIAQLGDSLVSPVWWRFLRFCSTVDPSIVVFSSFSMPLMHHRHHL